MKHIPLFLIILFSLSPTNLFSESDDIQHVAKYPELEILDQYVSVADSMISGLLNNAPKHIDKELQKAKIKDFIFSVRSFDYFESFIVGDDQILIDGNKKVSIRDTEQYTQAVKKTKYMARSMAIMIVSNCIDVYFRKELQTDPITKRLFENSNDFEHDKIIAWITKKYEPEDFKEETKFEYDFSPGDEIYHYRSPEFSWKMEFGRRGFVVFRNNKLIKKFVTIMN